MPDQDSGNKAQESKESVAVVKVLQFEGKKNDPGGEEKPKRGSTNDAEEEFVHHRECPKGEGECECGHRKHNETAYRSDVIGKHECRGHALPLQPDLCGV
jgi:hypothetical protein